MITREETDKTIALHLPRWDELPAFLLYNEQLMALVEESLAPLYGKGESFLTKSMINNYVKWQYLPKPYKKKYGKEHVARLMVITALKPVLTMAKIHRGIENNLAAMEGPAAYDAFCDELEGAVSLILGDDGESVQPPSPSTPEKAVVVFACRSLAYQLAATVSLREDKTDDKAR